MSRFQRTRDVLNAVDASLSSASSLDPVLSSLSPEDAEVLDTIIAKVPNATAFMTVFKAYSEVLRQRGLDPGNDVVYYKQLLKLGVVKGADWSTKWSIVKNQLGLDSSIADLNPSRRLLTSKFSKPSRLQYEEDVFTLHSHADETETAVEHQNRRIFLPGPSLRTEASMTVDDIDSLDLPSKRSINLIETTPTRPLHQLNIPPFQPNISVSALFDDKLDPPARESTPPHYHLRRKWPVSFTSKTRHTSERSPEHNAPRINDAEAWKKIEHVRQVEDADRFRRESLLSTYLLKWKAELDWFKTTRNQLDKARNEIGIKTTFFRWRMKMINLQRISERADEVAAFRARSVAFSFWKQQAHRRKIIEWRKEMRSKMVYFKQKREGNISNDAWTKWRQLYLSRQLYTQTTLSRAFRRWRIKQRSIENLENAADTFEDARERRLLENAMELWCRRAQFHDAERYIVDRVTRRSLIMVFETWIRNFQDNRQADAHHSKIVMKHAFLTLQKAKAQKIVINLRVDKYVKRRNNLLLRAIIRVWVARERGQLLHRVRDTKIIRNAFTIWRRHLQRQKEYQERAILHYRHTSDMLVLSMYKEWMRHRVILQDYDALARERYTSSLMYRTMLVWRLQLRTVLKRLRKARMARKYFLERQVWDQWRLVLENKRRYHILHILETDKLRVTFQNWLSTVRRRNRQDQVIKACQKRMRRRLLRDALQHWTNRVVYNKLREIDIGEQQERYLLSVAFAKWKDIYVQHFENLSLMNSFQDVKREDTLRRVLNKWSIAARKARSRRLRLAEREHELRLGTLVTAWEIWRDHFRENKLRDLEYQVLIQSQKNLIYQALINWQSRSKSVPGIRFHATNLKAKFWEKWRSALPLALRARKARGLYSKVLLSTIFNKWKGAYRTKIALKAVARARNLRLPSPGHRIPVSRPQTQDPLPLRPSLYRPLRSHASEAADHNHTPSTNQQTAPLPIPRRRGLSSLLASRPVSRAPTTDSSRVLAPISAAEDERRDRIWNQLRGAQIHDSAVNKAKSR